VALQNKKYAMIIDTRRCVGCTACVITCKSENNVPNGYCRDWVDQIIKGHYPRLTLINRSDRCQHCEKAPCVSNCPTGASYYPGDGTVIVDRSKCTGCKACLAACPYDARYVHPSGFVDKCSFCRHRLLRGETTTACTSICPTDALTLVDLNSPDGLADRLMDGREVVQDKTHAGTHPKLFWLL
jgi:Fe-S-cluster-containing dehydrogenase component